MTEFLDKIPMSQAVLGEDETKVLQKRMNDVWEKIASILSNVHTAEALSILSSMLAYGLHDLKFTEEQALQFFQRQLQALWAEIKTERSNESNPS